MILRLLALFVSLMVLGAATFPGAAAAAPVQARQAAAAMALQQADAGSTAQAPDLVQAPKELPDHEHTESLLDVPELFQSLPASFGPARASARLAGPQATELVTPYLEGLQRPPCATRLA